MLRERLLDTLTEANFPLAQLVPENLHQEWRNAKERSR